MSAKSSTILTVLGPAMLALVATAAGGCKSKESNLEKMARTEGGDRKGEVGTVTPSSTSKGEVEPSTDSRGAETKPTANAETPVDEHGIPLPPLEGAVELISPGADSDQVSLRLALDEGARYRIMTIGMLELPLLNRPTGFAREEQVELSACEGQADERSCLLTHTYRNYEAEPPAGSGLEADERAVAEIETAHRIDASGLRTTTTAVHGQATPELGKQLAEIHRLYCIRFPEVPVGVGATWRDVCRTRQGGRLVTRELTWRLAKVEDSEDGRRAQIEYAGRVRRLDKEGKIINGDVKGALFFWVDAGEPHRIREALGFVLDPVKNFGTKTDLRYDFAKLDEDGETLLRTDGKPFELSPALNNPRAAPSGTTRDAEQPGKTNEGK